MVFSLISSNFSYGYFVGKIIKPCLKFLVVVEVTELVILCIRLVLHRSIVSLIHHRLEVIIILLLAPLADTLVSLVIKVKLGKVIVLNVSELVAILSGLYLLRVLTNERRVL